jgi:mono/diheme cytochrome c family protein
MSVLLLIAGGLLAQEAQKPEEKPAAAIETTPKGSHNYNLTTEDIARKNPVPFTEASVARGKKRFQSQCAMCHGQNGDGKGEAVEEMKITPPDFTKPETFKDRTDGALFVILGAGSDTMPGQGTRMTEKEKWDLVNYLRAVGGKVPEKSTGKEPEENIILVPQKP